MEVRSTGNAIPAVVASAPKAVIASEAAAAAKPAPVETALAVRQSAPAPDLDELAQAVKNLNKALQAQTQNLEFSIDTDSNRTVVKLIDQSTNEVLRQMPTKEALEIARSLDKMQGTLIRQKA